MGERGKRDIVELSIVAFMLLFIWPLPYLISLLLSLVSSVSLTSHLFLLPIEKNLGKKWTFIVAAICGVVGILVTWILVPNITGDDLKHNDEKFREFLVANGWNGEMGEDDLQAPATAPPTATHELSSATDEPASKSG